jgi:hypothetical protein
MPPPAKSTPQHHLVSVFEAVNDSAKEIYLGTTILLSEQLTAQFQRTPPPAVAHWKPGQRVFVKVVEYSIPLKDARAFIDHYAESAASAGWAVLKEAA